MKGKALLERSEHRKQARLSSHVEQETDSQESVESLLAHYAEIRKQDQEAVSKLLSSTGAYDARVPTLKAQLSRVFD